MGRNRSLGHFGGKLDEEASGENIMNDGESFFLLLVFWDFFFVFFLSLENIFPRYIKMEMMAMMTMGCSGVYTHLPMMLKMEI